MNKYDTLTHKLDSGINSSLKNLENFDSQGKLYMGLSGEKDSKLNRRYLLTRNSMQMTEKLNIKPSQENFHYKNRNNSNNMSHNLASLNTSIVSGSSLQKRVRISGNNKIKDGK